MSEAAQPDQRVRRILVALDSSTFSEAALALAADIAAATTSTLSGLFVEDQDLLRLAQLPFSREIQAGFATSRDLQPEGLLRDLRAQAALARSALAEQAERRRIAWSFQVAQGRCEEAVLTAALGGDIIAVTRHFGPFGQAARVSERIRRMAARAPAPLLILNNAAANRPGPTVMPYDASPASEGLFRLATAICRARGDLLEVLLLESAEAAERTLRAEFEALVGERGSAGLRLSSPPNRTAALRRLSELDRGLLVLQADSGSLEPAQIELILERARVPILLHVEGDVSGKGS